MEYQTILTLKESGKATVELAAADVFDGPVVIKRLRGGKAEIYQKIAGQENPHIPKIYAVEEAEEELLVVEEYIEGESLREYLQQNLLSDEEKICLALQLCDAVEFLHAMKPMVIHRDIKPSNILVNSKGQLKLIDFDASRQYKEATDESDTRLLGTVSYAPPEQFGFSQTDARSDIYSMGVVFHEMCPTQDLRLAERWEKISEKCTSFDPKNRYQNVAELKRELKKLGERKRQKQMGIFGMAVAVILLLIALALYFIPAEKKDPERTEPTNAPTLTPTVLPTSSPTPTLSPTPTSTPTPEPVKDRTKELLEELKEQKYAVKYVDKRREYPDYFMMYDAMFEQKELEFTRVELTNLETEETILVPKEQYHKENRIFHIKTDYLKEQENGCYRLCLEFENTATGWSGSLSIHLWMNEENAENGEWPLAGNRLEFFYEYMDGLHVILNHSVDGKMKETGTYSVLEDGRVAEFDYEFLMQFMTPGQEGKVMFTITLEDGSEQDVVVEYRTGKPYYMP